MSTLPFQTYQEAKSYFQASIPKSFFDKLITLDTYCNIYSLDIEEALSALFGIVKIESNDARYQQTPIELFPFGGTGVDGVHYGFVIHVDNEEDYPAGELCPMDSDGVILMGCNTQELFQNLLAEEIPDVFLPLLSELKLDPVSGSKRRYDQEGHGLSLAAPSLRGWKFIPTMDGTGVFAEEKFFDTHHETHYDVKNRMATIEKYEALAEEMRSNGFYASQLYYLKQLYWEEWTNYELAKKYLQQMLLPYEKLGRKHLYQATEWVLGTFDKRYT